LIYKKVRLKPEEAEIKKDCRINKIWLKELDSIVDYKKKKTKINKTKQYYSN